MSVRKRGERYVAAIYDPATRCKRHVGTFDSRKEARHAEAQAMLDRKRRPDPVTVEAFAARWTAPGGSYSREKESTNIHNADGIRKFRRDFGARPLTSITRVEAREWAHANRWRHKAVRAMFSDAVRDELLDHNPFVGLRFKEARGRRDLIVPTEAEVAELAEIAGRVHGAWGERVYAHLITTAAYTGLRPGELYGLEWRDVDWDREQVRVERQFNQATRTLTLPKNGLKRTIYMLPQAKAALEQVQRTSRDWVFCGPTGVRFSGRIQSGYWGPVRNLAGHPEWDFYALRHAFGTYLANLGLGPYEIAQALGHRDGGKLAMDRYIHQSETDSMARIKRAVGRAHLTVIEGAREQTG